MTIASVLTHRSDSGRGSILRAVQPGAVRRVLVVLGAATVLGGCAHSVFYSEVRDKQGEAVKRVSKDLKILDSFSAMDKSYAEVMKLELESAESLAATRRDKELARVGRAAKLRDEKGNGLINVLEDRMDKLGAKRLAVGKNNAGRNCGILDCDALDVLRTTPELQREQQGAFDLSRAEFRSMVGYDFQTCAGVKAASTGDRKASLIKKEFAEKFTRLSSEPIGAIENSFGTLFDTCDRINTTQSRFKTAFRSDGKPLIGTALLEAEIAEGEIEERKAQFVKAQAQLADAVNAFKKEEEQLASPKQGFLGTLEERAAKLTSLLDTVSKGLKGFAAQARIEHLENVVGALGGQKSSIDKLDADTKASIVLVRAIPELADEADKLLKEAGKARLAPFMLARDHYRLTVKGFQDEFALKTHRMEAIRARAMAMSQELSTLAQVHFLLTEPKNRGDWQNRSVSDLHSKLDPKERRELENALATYSDDVFRFRLESQLWGIKAIASQHDQALAQSKVAAMQWENLIRGTANVLADYHASGVKTSEIAEFLKAFGLIYIGSQVK